MKYEGLLPIGTVVGLKEIDHQIMITGFTMQRKTEQGTEVYDYAGCPFPEGMLGPDKTFLFNQGSINRVYTLGYLDDVTIRYLDQAEAELTAVRKGEDHG